MGEACGPAQMARVTDRYIKELGLEEDVLSQLPHFSENGKDKYADLPLIEGITSKVPGWMTLADIQYSPRGHSHFLYHMAFKSWFLYEDDRTCVNDHTQVRPFLEWFCEPGHRRKIDFSECGVANKLDSTKGLR